MQPAQPQNNAINSRRLTGYPFAHEPFLEMLVYREPSSEHCNAAPLTLMMGQGIFDLNPLVRSFIIAPMPEIAVTLRASCRHERVRA
jgi:hypothetical protein